MSTLTPPVKIGDPNNQSRVDYIHEVATAADFDYPSVSEDRIFLCFSLRNGRDFYKIHVSGIHACFLGENLARIGCKKR